MQKKYFVELATYNQWANHTVISWLNLITEEQWNAPVVSSFNSIGQTSLHIIGAEKIWLDRLQHNPNPSWLPATFAGSKTDAMQVWEAASAGLLLFTQDLEEAQLSAPMKYKRLNGEEYEHETYKILAHIFNHSAYHRGQLVTQLRQMGFEDVTTLDLLSYYNLKF